MWVSASFNSRFPNFIFIVTLDDRLVGEVWTAGRDTEKSAGKYRWCSNLLNDYVKQDLYWKESPAGKKDSCIYLDFGAAVDKKDDPKLGFANCEQRKKFLCEVRKFIFKKTGEIYYLFQVGTVSWLHS